MEIKWPFMCHFPKNAIDEAKNLMLASNNMLRPADGSPMSSPSSKEIALGIYFLTSLDDRLDASKTVFADKHEALTAYSLNIVKLRQLITVRHYGQIMETTAGRLMFNEALPEGFGYVNENVSSNIIKDLTDRAFNEVSNDRLAQMIDDIKNLGFLGGTLSGLSFSVADARVHPQKQQIIDEANKKVVEIEQNFAQGLITAEEKKRLIENIWIETTEVVADKTWELVEPTSSIRIVIDAKVGRTSREQIKQLSGMRGLVVDPLGNIVELPVKSNFREGLSVFEYVTSSRGSRKGLTDTALKTADAGYLTRRLVDVAHDMIIREDDCGAKEFLEISKTIRSDAFLKRIVGRYAGLDIKDSNGEVLVPKGNMISEDDIVKIDKAEVESVSIRSPFTCKTRYGICKKCYGWDLSSKKEVEFGVPVGVLAAQSIGEPGTQLTMRTKHSGGVVGVDVTQGLPRVEELFESRIPKALSPLAEIPGKVKVTEEEDGWKVLVKSTTTKDEERQYVVSKTNKLLVEDGQLVDEGTQISSGFLDIKELLQIKGLKAAQEYLVTELQRVYESQGIPISDKHFEIIVRKMSDDVRIMTAGDTQFLPGEQVDKAQFEEENEKTVAAGGEPASARQIILGITRRAILTDSWLSAASFEQTTNVLATSALMGKKDLLRGLKENVIIGRLIPVMLEEQMQKDKPEVVVENIVSTELPIAPVEQL